MCDTIVSPGKSSKDGFTIFGKNSDRSCNEPQCFVHVAAADHDPGEIVHCTYINVDQASHTHAMILSKPSWVWGAEMGVNEHGVCIGNEAVFTKEVRKEPALLGMDILRIGLERSENAREAIETMTKVLEQYGQGGNAGFDSTFYYDNSFIITDAKETWLLETAGEYWAAKQVHRAFSISNHLVLDRPTYMHKRTIDNAIRKGYSVSQPFDFTNAYIDWDHPANISGIVRRFSSTRALDALDGSVQLSDVLQILRSHTTSIPWTNGDKSICKHGSENSASTSTNSVVVVLEPGNLALWGTGMSTPCIAPYQPFWFDTYSHALVHDYEKQSVGYESWLRSEQINRAIVDGRISVCEYQSELREMEGGWFREVASVAKSDRQELCDLITQEVEVFKKKWLSVAESSHAKPLGSVEFGIFWENKNNELGKHVKITY